MTGSAVAPVPTIEASALRKVAELGVGGQGRVHLVEGPFSGVRAYKEYAAEIRATLDEAALQQIVALPRTADDDLRELLSERAAWPVACVAEAGTISGFLMPVAPAEFSSYLRIAGKYEARMLAMEFLLNPPEYMARVDLPVSERIRVELLRAFAADLCTLQSAGIVIGDLSPKNVLIGLRPPRCYLLDCDAVRVAGRSALPQVETPDWQVPTGEELATPATDRYKFALLAIRLLGSDQTVDDPGFLRASQPALADLSALALSAAPAERPGLDAWVTTLDEALPGASTGMPVPAPTPPAATAPTPAAPTPAPSMPWVPPPGQPGRRSGTGSGRRWGAVLVGILGLIALVCVITISANGDDDPVAEGGYSDGSGSYTQTYEPETYDPGPGYTEEPAEPVRTLPPTVGPRVGMVDTSQVADGTDPATLPVAQFLDSYFSGINGRDWDAVLAHYDPGGVVNPDDPESRQSFAKAMSTTQDSDVALLQVNSDNGSVQAHVTFRSRQEPPNGPAGRPNERCTEWDLRYQLTGTLDALRILRPSAADSQPCAS